MAKARLSNLTRQVFNSTFRPRGYCKGNSMYYSLLDRQIHAIQFQASKYGGRYFVNAGFHFNFLPRMLDLRFDVDLSQFYILDFLMYIRLENLMPESYPRDWAYGINVEKDVRQLSKNAENAIAAIEEIGSRWKEPVSFINAFPPDLLIEDIREALRRSELVNYGRGLPLLPVDTVLGGNWQLPRSNLAVCNALIAKELKKDSLAKKYLKIAETEAEGSEVQLKCLSTLL